MNNNNSPFVPYDCLMAAPTKMIQREKVVDRPLCEECEEFLWVSDLAGRQTRCCLKYNTELTVYKSWTNKCPECSINDWRLLEDVVRMCMRRIKSKDAATEVADRVCRVMNEEIRSKQKHRR